MRHSWWWTPALLGLSLFVSSAGAQTPVRVRGTIVAIDGKVLAVKSRDGRDLRIELADNLTVAVAKAITFADVKQGDYAFAVAQTGADGTLTAAPVQVSKDGVKPPQ